MTHEELKEVRNPTGVMTFQVSFFQEAIRVDFSCSPHFNKDESKKLGEEVGEVIANKIMDIAQRRNDAEKK